MKKVACLFCALMLLAAAGARGEIWLVEEEASRADTAAREEARVEEILQGMTLAQKVYQLFIVTPEALTGLDCVTAAGAATERALENYPVGGIVYFSQNLVSTAQTQKLLSGTQAYAAQSCPAGLFLCVDEEGGTVSRVAANLGTTRFESMAAVGARGDADEAYRVGATIAADLAALGFNVDFAPVADVVTGKGTEIGARSFGGDPALVSGMVSQVVRGLQEGGVIATLKHFPGQGTSRSDTHTGASQSAVTLEALRETDLTPFAAGIAAGAGMVMVGHVTYTNIDAENPASLSSAIITGLLREQLGYDGVVITDALRMSAISNAYGPGEAALRALEAGADVLLLSRNFKTAAQGIFDALESGRLAPSRIDESVRRILTLKAEYGLVRE